MFPEQVEFNKIGDSPVRFFPLEAGDAVLVASNDQISIPKTELIAQGLCLDQTVISSISGITAMFLHKQHLVVGTEYEVKLYCVRPWKDKKTIFQSSDLVRAVCLQNDGYLAIGTDNSSIEMFNISNPLYSIQLKGHKNAVTGLQFSPDGQVLISTCCDGTMRVWAKSMRSDGWDCIHSFPSTIKKFRPEELRYPFCWNPTGLYGCVANADGDLELVENITWETKLKIKTTDEVLDMKFSPNGLYLATIEGKVLSCWKIFDGRPKLVMRQKHATNLKSLSWHPKKNDLMLADDAGELIYYGNFVPSDQQDAVKAVLEEFPFLQTGNDNIENEKELFGDEDDDMAPFADLDAMEDKDEEDPKPTPNAFRKSDNIEKNDEMIAENGEEEEEDIADFIEDDDGGGYMEDINKERNMEVYQRRTLKNTLGDIIEKYGQETFASTEKEVISGSHREVQQSFQPGSSSPQGKKHYVLLNLVGTVCVVESGLQYTVDVTFHDISLRSFHFSSHNHYKLAALGNSGLVCASECTTSLPSSIFYRPLNGNWNQKNDWSVSLNEGENCVAVALGGSNVVVATDYQYLRFFSTSGLQQGVKSAPGPIVSIAADGNMLIVVYHQSGAFHGNQSLGFFLLEMSTGAMIREGTLPISPFSTLKWLGFSRSGVPLTYDSEGTLRALYYHSSILWTPVFESKIFRGVKNDLYWPVGAAEDVFLCVICKGRTEPEFPNPLISDLPLSIPFCQMDSERTKLEQAATLSRLNLYQQKGQTDNPDRFVLQTILQKENELDKIALQLFLSACKNELTERAIDVSSYFNSLKCFDGAMKLASSNQLSQLAEKLGQIKQMKMRAAENDSHAMIESFREPAPVVVESRQEFPRFSHFTEDEPMKIVPKSRSRIMDDEEDNYPPMNTNEPSMDDDSQQRQELPIEPTPKVAKPKGNPFAKSKVDASALKKIIKVGIVEDEPEKKKRRTNITDFVIRASGNVGKTAVESTLTPAKAVESFEKVLAPSSSTKSSISLLDQFKFKSKPAVAEPSENADSVDMDMDKGDNTQVVTEKENVTNNVDPKGKLPLHPRDSNVAL